VNKRLLKKYIFLIIAFIAYVCVEYLKPRPIDWEPYYENSKKTPFGTYVLFNTLDTMFGEQVIETDINLYNFIKARNDEQIFNYIIITNELEINELEINSMLKTAENGANYFIAANFFARQFCDTLGFCSRWNFMSKEINLKIVNQSVTDSSYTYDNEVDYVVIDYFDSLNTKIVGQLDNHSNYIRIKHGKGNFYIHTQPKVFTNFYLLKANNYRYVFNALSCLPKQKTFWDEYYKPNKKVHQTEMYYILEQEAFRYAYWTLLAGIIIFLIFEIRKRQKTIPVYKQLKNNSLDFIRTIGQLYFHNKNHKDIANKKILYLLEFIRNKYYLHLKLFDTNELNIVSEKVGVEKKLIQKLFQQIIEIKEANSLENKKLLHLSNLIEDFYKQAN